MTEKGIHDKKIACCQLYFAKRINQRKSTVYHQTDFVVFMNVRCAVQKIYEKYMKVVIVVGDYFIFILYHDYHIIAEKHKFVMF